MIATTPTATGDERRDEVLNMLESRSALYVLRGRRAMLVKLLEVGLVSADDVNRAVELQSDVDPRCLGAIPKEFSQKGIIRGAGFVKSQRPERNGSYIQKWALADRTAAVEWLRENPDVPDTPPDNEKTGQLQLPGMFD